MRKPQKHHKLEHKFTLTSTPINLNSTSCDTKATQSCNRLGSRKTLQWQMTMVVKNLAKKIFGLFWDFFSFEAEQKNHLS